MGTIKNQAKLWLYTIGCDLRAARFHPDQAHDQAKERNRSRRAGLVSEQDKGRKLNSKLSTHFQSWKFWTYIVRGCHPEDAPRHVAAHWTAELRVKTSELTFWRQSEQTETYNRKAMAFTSWRRGKNSVEPKVVEANVRKWRHPSWWQLGGANPIISRNFHYYQILHQLAETK